MYTAKAIPYQLHGLLVNKANLVYNFS